LLDQRQDAGEEDPWTWVCCALWSIVGERADGLDGMPEKPSAVPEGIYCEQRSAAKLRVNCLAMDWASFLRGFSRKEPGLAWSQLVKKPDLGASGGDASERILSWAAEEAFGNWAKLDPEQAHQAILDGSDDGRDSTTVAAVAGFHLGVPADKRSAYLSDLFSLGHLAGLSHPEGMQGVAAGVWARSEPDAALAWLKQKLPKDQKLPVKAALRAFLGRWAEEPESLYRWCEIADAGSKSFLGDLPITTLLYDRPLLAAALVEDGWRMNEPPDLANLVSSRQPFYPEDVGNPNTWRAAWSDSNLTDGQWRLDFLQALPVFGIPEAVQEELLEALDRSLISRDWPEDEEVDR